VQLNELFDIPFRSWNFGLLNFNPQFAMTSKLFFASFALLFSLVACTSDRQSAQDNTEQSTAQDSVQSQAAETNTNTEPAFPEPLSVHLEYERSYYPDSETGKIIEDMGLLRSTKVFAIINGKKIEIAEPLMVETLDAQARQEYKVPADALAAAGGWWAGGGDYIYLQRKGNEIHVMHCMVGEGMSDEELEDPYQYKLAKVIKPEDL
jgi:hypothetical protein